MSKPETFSLTELERDIRKQIVGLQNISKTGIYDGQRWRKLQRDFDYYVSHVKRLLKLNKL